MSELFHDGNSTAVKSGPRLSTHSTDDGKLPIALQLDLIVQDRDIIAALEHYPEGDERNQFAMEALKIGVLALRHVGGQASADLIQRESTRLVKDMQQTLQQHLHLVQGRYGASVPERPLPGGEPAHQRLADARGPTDPAGKPVKPGPR